MIRFLRQRWKVILCGVVCFTAGFIIRGFLPPFVLDEPFWRDFWTSPAAGGVFALVGAFIAYCAAYRASSVHRRTAKREEWWARAQWALDLARSDIDSDRIIGLEALAGLTPEATEAEFRMILAVTEAVAPEHETVDSESVTLENGHREGDDHG